MKSSWKTLLAEKLESGILIITLNRPKQLNGLSSVMLAELSELIEAAASDEDIRVLVLTGGDRVFAAGGDIDEISALDGAGGERIAGLAQQTAAQIEELGKPVIAAICGPALGGAFELAMAADIRVAAEDAMIGLTQINLGIIPGAGGTYKLSRMVGLSWAKHLILTGETISGDTAFRIGLVTRVVPGEQVMEAALELANKLESKSPMALKKAKNCINEGINMDLNSSLLLEKQVWSFIYDTEDQKEAFKAFREKRKPIFKGR